MVINTWHCHEESGDLYQYNFVTILRNKVTILADMDLDPRHWLEPTMHTVHLYNLAM
jgi:hypothetical protein